EGATFDCSRTIKRHCERNTGRRHQFPARIDGRDFESNRAWILVLSSVDLVRQAEAKNSEESDLKSPGRFFQNENSVFQPVGTIELDGASQSDFRDRTPVDELLTLVEFGREQPIRAIARLSGSESAREQA